MCDGDTHTPTHAHTLAMIHTHTYTYKRTLPHSICGLIWLSVAHDADKKKTRTRATNDSFSAQLSNTHTHVYMRAYGCVRFLFSLIFAFSFVTWKISRTLCARSLGTARRCHNGAANWTAKMVWKQRQRWQQQVVRH